MKRILGGLAAGVIAALLIVQPVSATQGDENLPCSAGGLFVLHANSAENIAILEGRGLVFDKTVGSVTHLIFPGPLDQSAFNAIMVGFVKEGAGQPDLVLSHCLEGSTPSPTPSSTPTSTVSPSPSASPTSTPTPSATPTPTATTSPSPTVEPSPSSTPLPSSTPTPTLDPSPSFPDVTPPPTDTESSVETLANVATAGILLYIGLTLVGLAAAVIAFVYIGRRLR